MHIAFLIPDLKGGGAQKMIINLANWFASKGHRTDLILLDGTGLYKDLIAPAVTVHDFKKSRSLYGLKDLALYLKKDSPDILFSALYHVNVVALLARFFSGNRTSKIVISERNHLTRNLASKNKLSHFMWTRLISWLYPMSEHVIGISNGVCQDLKKRIPALKDVHLETIYNPVISDNLESNIPSVFPEHAGVKIITSGRLVPQKDYPTLLKAFALYHQKNKTAHLVILGTGFLDVPLKEMANTLEIEQNVTFTGFVDTPLSYLKQADLFIMTSAWEGFCNVIVEALYCGLNIVATDCPSGPAEILDNGKYGTLCPIGDSASITDAIETTLTKNPPAMQKERALDFHVDKIGVQFQKRFEALIQ